MTTKPMMTRAEARAWKARWMLVNDFQLKELRGTSPEMKMRQLASLIELAKQFGWTKTLAKDKAKIWQRWNKLRKAYGV